MRLRNIPNATKIIDESTYVIKEPTSKIGNWNKVFGNNNPIHIEIGMGKGNFLMALAERNPDINYLGVELYDSVLLRAVQKREQYEKEKKLTNLFYLNVNAADLPTMFNKGEISKIYLNFSDPWPKAKHHKRRLTSREFLDRYSRFLVDNGLLEFKTDNQDLFKFSLEEIPYSKFTLLYETKDFHREAPELLKDNVMTEYEEKFSSMGYPICKMILKASYK